MNYPAIALTLVGVLEVGLLWIVARRLNRLDQVESRLGHLTDALTLLTETAESGFRANGQEIARVAEGASKSAAASRTTTRRVTSAAKKGRAISEIAAVEQVSEGEVNLRLHLAEAAAARPKGRRTTEARHGAMRA